VHAGQSTALHDAWVRGGLEVSAHLDAGSVNRVLLVSDGLANVGESRPDVIVSRAAELFSRGVSTSTVGVGGDFNEDLMIPMAVSGGGAGWFVERPEDFTRIFEAELTGLAALYGERGVLRIEPRRAGVALAEVLNDFPIAAGGGWAVGSLSHGHPLEIVARIKAPGGEVGQPLDLLDVRLELDAVGQGHVAMQQLLRIGCDRPEVVDAMPSDAAVERVVLLLMAARARLEAIAHADTGDLGTARGVLERVMQSLFTTRFSRDPEIRSDGEQVREMIRSY